MFALSASIGLRVVVLARDPETPASTARDLCALGAVARATSDWTPAPDAIVVAHDFDRARAKTFARAWVGLGANGRPRRHPMER